VEGEPIVSPTGKHCLGSEMLRPLSSCWTRDVPGVSLPHVDTAKEVCRSAMVRSWQEARKGMRFADWQWRTMW
jgi:hypothetical protein